MPQCQAQEDHTRRVHVMPNNARGHWRATSRYSTTCPKQAVAQVHVLYPDGLEVHRLLCRAHADAFRCIVLQRGGEWREEPV